LSRTDSYIEFRREAIEHSIPARFERQVLQNADRSAVITDGETLTYNDLNRFANQIANLILERCGEGQEAVAIIVANDATAIAGLLGILKAGKISVPVDAGLPAARGRSIITDSQARLIITASEHVSMAQVMGSGTQDTINLDEITPDMSDDNPSVSIAPADMAHIIYTSGSTSEPKGVIDIHRNVLHHVMVVTNSSHYCMEDRMTLVRAPSSTGGLANVYSALLNGACLFPFDVQNKGVAQLASWLIAQDITVYHSSATVFRHFVQTLEKNDGFPHLRLIRLGSEQVTKNEFQRFRQHFSSDCILVNALSCTEAITFCQNFLNKNSIVAGEIVPVGYAVPDMEILLLDDARETVESGESGEIAIRSEFLSPGYWRKPELTRKAFLQRPGDDGRRVYLTGDMGRMNADGCLEHIGRKDFQIKIRGHRVNTDDLEIMLLALPCIKEVAVVARESMAGDRRLIAYLVFKAELSATVSQLRHLLSEKLPMYMIPSTFVVLDALPLTVNGKIDRRALPDPPVSRPELDIPFVVPRTFVEETTSRIWSEALGVEEVGIHDNFFDLGGDSLLASRVAANVRKQFHCILSLKEFFEASTVAGIAARIEKAVRKSRKLKPPQMTIVPREGSLPLSFAQEQLWLLNELLPGTHLFNLSSAYRLSGFLDVSILEESLSKLVKRHEIFRAIFAEVEGQPVQIIGPGFDTELPMVDLRHLPAARREKKAAQLAGTEASCFFDLAKGPLIRTKLFQLAQDEHVLVVTIHHIICDGWSIQVFWNELAHIYEALSRGREPSLPEIPVQFADFVRWEQHALDDKSTKAELRYWEKQLAGTFSTLRFIRGNKRKKAISFRTAQLPIELDENHFSALKDFSRQERSTPFMVLLTALDVTLHAYTGQKDIRVGTLVANRDRAETEGLIGHLINTVILGSRIFRKMTLRQLLTQVRDTTLAAYANQHLPFEHLVRTLERKRKIRRTSLFQVMFIYHNMTVPSPEPMTLIFKPEDKLSIRPDPGATLTTFDLILVLKETSKGLVGTFTFKRDTLDSRKANGILQKFIRNLEYLMASPESTISRACRKIRA
jgi:amino acid adenylation domain-containing protein